MIIIVCIKFQQFEKGLKYQTCFILELNVCNIFRYVSAGLCHRIVEHKSFFQHLQNQYKVLESDVFIAK